MNEFGDYHRAAFLSQPSDEMLGSCLILGDYVEQMGAAVVDEGVAFAHAVQIAVLGAVHEVDRAAVGKLEYLVLIVVLGYIVQQPSELVDVVVQFAVILVIKIKYRLPL